MGGSFKKFISIVCVLSLLIGMLPSSAFAAPDAAEAERAAESVTGTANKESGGLSADRGGSFSPRTGELGDGHNPAWIALQNAITAAQDGDTITLTEDVTAGSEDSQLVIQNYKSLTIDLNGHTIDRNMQEAANAGYAIYLLGNSNYTVTIKGSGTITGGWCERDGGGIYVNGMNLSLEGSVQVTGNKAETDGGGIYMSGGTLYLCGNSSVTGNTAEGNGGGVYVDGCFLEMHDSSSITANTANGSGGGVYARNGELRLKGGSVSGNSAVNASTNGICLYGDALLTVYEEDDNAVTVTDSIYLPAGKIINVNDTPADGSTIHVTLEQLPTSETPVVIAESEENCTSNFVIENQPADTELVWENGKIKLIKVRIHTWADLQEALNDGGTWEYREEGDVYVIRLTEDVIAGSDDVALNFHYDAHPVILDLNGHKIDRHLTAPQSDGNVLNVISGKLILRDSKGGGSITGGNNMSSGGGVHVQGGIFSMESGSITGNTVQYDNGAGVYLSGGAFDLRGGSITGNNAARGGGVYVASASGFQVSGNPIVTGNGDSNVYLAEGAFIIRGGELTEGASIGIGAAYEGTFTTAFVYEEAVDPAFFTPDSGHRFYKDSSDFPAIERAGHYPGEPTWTWEEDLSSATLRAVCQNCGETLWSETSTMHFEHDQYNIYLYAAVSATHDGTGYTDRKEVSPEIVREVSPSIDGNGTYRFGMRQHFEVKAGDKTYYFTSVMGHADQECELNDLVWNTFTISATSQNNGIIENYVESVGRGTTEIDLPLQIENTVGQETAFVPLKMLGNGRDAFYTVDGYPDQTPDHVEITDRGSITNVSAATFAGLSNLTLNLNAQEPITIAEGAFTDCNNVTIKARHASGLQIGGHDDPTGHYTVEMQDEHSYIAAAAWAEDYSTADITITCSGCGDTHTFQATQITQTETEKTDPDTQEKKIILTITAEGTYEGDGKTYTVTLEEVPYFNVTVEGMEGTLRLPKAQGKEYAVFTVKQHMLDPLNPPAGAVLDGLTDGSGKTYVVDNVVEIMQDTHFSAKWSSVWALVQAALNAGGNVAVTLYSDITPAEGDSYLHIPASTTATLDLANYTVNRGLSTAIADGYAIRVDGNLNLKNGTVTGGNNTGDGGGVYLFDGGYLETNNVTVRGNNAQNGGGVCMVDASQAELKNSAITYNRASQKGGGLYVGGERPSQNLGAPSQSSFAKLEELMLSNNSAQNGGGLYVNSGEVQIGSKTNIVNNTDLDGKNFNNINVAENAGTAISIAEEAEAVSVALPAVTAGLADLAPWAVAVVVAALGILSAIIYFDRVVEGEGDDQRKECEHPSKHSDLEWEEDRYSNVEEYVWCTECGRFLEKNDLTPSTSEDQDTKVTTYKVEPQYPSSGDTEREVGPYKLTKQANIPSGIEKTDSDFEDRTELIAHKRHEEKTVQLPTESPWSFKEGLKFDGWLKGETKVEEVTFSGSDDDEEIKVKVKWKLAYGYAPNDSEEEPATNKDEHPLKPDSNPKYVESGTEEEIKENKWKRDNYKFSEWKLPSSVKAVKKNEQFELEYKYDDGETKKKGDKIKIELPRMLRAEWQTKWKDLAETLEKDPDYAVSMSENVSALKDDKTIGVAENNSDTLDLKGKTLDGKSQSGVQHIFDVSGTLTVKDSTDEKNGVVTGGRTDKNGAGAYIKPGSKLILESGSIKGNVTEYKENGDPGHGGGVYIDGNSAKSGNFEMSGGSVNENKAYHSGGGVYITENGSFKMSGGEITGNMAGYSESSEGHKGSADAKGGGVYVGGSFEISGRVIVKDNKIGDEANNVYLPKDKTITIGGRLDDKAEIHVRMEEPGVITSGLNAKGGDAACGKAENFVSDDEDYKVIITDEGEAKLVDKNAKPKFSEARLELGGILRMRFYVELPEGWETKNDRVEFSLKDMEPLSIPYGDAQEDDEGKYFACPVNAYQMADTITAVYKHDGEETAKYEYTVKEYLSTLIHSGTNDQDALNLAAATANYGHYIQPYLANTNHWKLGVEHEVMDLYDEDAFSYQDNPATAYGLSFNTETSYARYVQRTDFYLTLDSDTMLNVRVYLQNPGDVVKGMIGDKELKQWTRAGNSVVICLDNVNAKELSEVYKFECYVNDVKVFTLDASALSYVNLALGREGASTEEKEALNALFNYAKAARDYNP